MRSTVLKTGKTVDQLETSVKMGKYKNWVSYEQWCELNVQGMART